MSRLCFVYTIGFVLRDPKLNYVQRPGFVEKRAKSFLVRHLCGLILKAENQLSKEGAFVREKPPWKLPFCIAQQNLPVGDFAAAEPKAL